MAESLTFDFEVLDKASREIQKIRKSMQGMTGAQADNAKATKAQSEQSKLAQADLGRLGTVTSRATALLNPYTLAIAAATGGVVALGAAARRAYDELARGVEAYEEQADVNRRLERSYQRAGLSAWEASQQFGAVQEAIGRLAVNTNFGDEDIASAITRFQEIRGEVLRAGDAYDELNIILGIAEREQTSAAAAAEKYAQALNGNIRGLLRVLPLEKSQVQELNSLEDAAERNRRVHELLSAEFAGLAQDIHPAYAASKNLSDAQGDLRQAIGGVIAESGGLEAVLNTQTQGLRELEGWIYANDEALRSWATAGLTVVAGGLQEVIDVGKGVISTVKPLVSAIVNFRHETDTTAGKIDFFTKALKSAVNGVNLALMTFPPVGGAMLAMRGAAGLLGFSLDDVGERAKTMASTIEEEVNQKALANAKEQVTEVNQAFRDLWSFIKEGPPEPDAQATNTFELRRRALEETNRVRAVELTLQADLRDLAEQEMSIEERRFRETQLRKKAEEDIRRIVDERRAAQQRELDEQQRQREEVARGARQLWDVFQRRMDAAAAEAKAIRDRKDLLQAELRVLASGSREAELRERLERDILAVKQQELDADVEALEIEVLRARHAQDLIDVRREEAAERQRLQQEAERLEEEAFRRGLERQREGARVASEAFSETQRFADEASRQQLAELERQREKIRQNEQLTAAEKERREAALEAEIAAQREARRTAQAFAQLTTNLTEVATQYQEMRKAGATSAQALAQSSSAAGAATSQFLESMGLGFREVAGIRALFETAAAASAYASGNIPGGIGHTAAALAFAKTAATGAGGGTASAGNAGAAAQQHQGGPRSPDMERVVQANKRAYLEALREHGGRGTSETIVFDQSGSYFFERDPVSQRRARRAVEGNPRLELG